MELSQDSETTRMCASGKHAATVPAELIPTVSEAVKMCEERGGSLQACEATFSTDPLVITANLIESH